MHFGNNAINHRAAVGLIKTGEWVREEDLINGAVKNCIQLINARCPKGGFEKYRELLVTLRKDPWPFESRVVVEPDSQLDPRLSVRVEFGRIVKIGQALRSPIMHALGLILYSATTTNDGGYLYLGFFILGWPLLQTLQKAFETIDDPDELLVFEMVATISGELRVVDPVALDRENFAEAYGKCAPYEEEISARLAPKISPHTVKKSLVALRKRNVLACVDDRWRIAF